jgi:aldo/keto reductase family protein
MLVTTSGHACRMMMCALVAATLATGPEVAAMRVRRLGRTGLKVAVIGVGTWQLGGEWGRRFTQPEVDRLLGRARELAVNLVDTAECYGDAGR